NPCTMWPPPMAALVPYTTLFRPRLADILSAPHPYRRWIVSGGGALLAVGVVALFGAGPLMWLIAAVTALIVDQTQRWLSRLGVRSEEHTSELQSRENLVCRLLL